MEISDYRRRTSLVRNNSGPSGDDGPRRTRGLRRLPRADAFRQARQTESPVRTRRVQPVNKYRRRAFVIRRSGVQTGARDVGITLLPFRKYLGKINFSRDAYIFSR